MCCLGHAGPLIVPAYPNDTDPPHCQYECMLPMLGHFLTFHYLTPPPSPRVLRVPAGVQAGPTAHAQGGYVAHAGPHHRSHTQMPETKDN